MNNITKSFKFCEKCYLLVGDYNSMLHIEPSYKDNYYVIMNGYYFFRTYECGDCDNKIISVTGELNNKVCNWSVKNWRMKESFNKWWAYYLVSADAIMRSTNERDKVLLKRIKYDKLKDSTDYFLFRHKENELYWSFEVFGYDGKNLYVKQFIGLKKENFPND